MVDEALEKAKSYATTLIRYRPRSEKELRSRLKEKGFSEEVTERIISDFKEKGLIDDRHFARLWAKTRAHSSTRGISLIRMELASKEVDKEIIDNAIDELRKDYNEEEAARELIKKRSRHLEGLDKEKARSRLYSYLKRRGFSSEVIYKLLNEAY